MLEHLHDSLGLSWGWSIIGLTIIVRVVIVPLMVKQIHSTQAMQIHMPEMKRIQQKYKGDRQRMNEEMMKFYKENSINPAAPCLPMLVQFPIFIALYFVLKNFTKHVTAAPARARLADRPEHHAQDHLALVGRVLLVVYVVSQVASGYFASAAAQRSQRILLMVLPVFFVPVITRFPVGLLMYWMTTNLWTVGQGIITRRMVPKPEAAPKRSSRTAPKDDRGDDAGNGAKVDGPEPKPAPAVAAAPRRVKRKKKRARR